MEDCIVDQLTMASTPTVQRNSNTTSKFRRERSVSGIVSGATTPTTAPDRRASIGSLPAAYVAVTDANFKAHHHRHGSCLAHPSGCDCEKVQRPTMGQNEAWQVMSMRFKAVHRDPDACWDQRLALLDPLSTGADAPIQRRASAPLPHQAKITPVSASANAPIKRRESEPLPRRAAAANVEDLRERAPRGGKGVVKVLARLPARSTGPAVLAVPSRVAQRLKPVGHDSRAGAASRHGGARDERDVPLPIRVSLSLPSRTMGGVRVSYI